MYLTRVSAYLPGRLSNDFQGHSSLVCRCVVIDEEQSIRRRRNGVIGGWKSYTYPKIFRLVYEQKVVLAHGTVFDYNMKYVCK